MRRYTGCPSSLHLAFYALLAVPKATMALDRSTRSARFAPEIGDVDAAHVGAAFPCASTYYNGSQRIEKTRFAAGARGRVGPAGVLE